MARIRSGQTAFNAGEFGEEMAARIDFERYGLAASRMVNWVPLAQGGMTRRQGFRIVESEASEGRLIGFSSSLALDYLAVARAGSWAFYYDDVRVSTEDNAATITNGIFATGLTGWTDSSTGSGSVAGGASGLELSVPASASGMAAVDQQITATSGLTYTILVTVETGPVDVAIGSAAGATDYGSGRIDAGEHVFEITPSSANFWLRFYSSRQYTVVVTSVEDYSDENVEIANSFTSSDLDGIDYDQVADVMFVASPSHALSGLSRRSTAGFGYGLEALTGGPLDAPDGTETTLTPSGVAGSVTITASSPIFESGDIGRSLRVSHVGQKVTLTATAENVYTDPIKVTGSGTFRQVLITASVGTGTQVLNLQRSFVSDDGPWDDKPTPLSTPLTEYKFDDEVDGQTIWYRIGIKTGEYAGNSTDMQLDYESGTTTGEAVITGYTSATEITARVEDPFSEATESSDWRISIFGGNNGYPSSVALHEGRLWIAGGSTTFGSVSDDYTNFLEGVDDDDAISRRTASVVRWLVSAGELSAGLNDKLAAGRTSDLDAPYTPLNFRMRDYSTEGSADVRPIAVDQSAVFVRRDKETVSEFAFNQNTGGYSNVSLTRLNPQITLGGVKRLAFQKSPERRVWVLKETGELLLLTYLRDENVIGWSRVEMDGFVEDVAVVSGERRDRIYIHAVRDGTRYLMTYDDERWVVPSQSNHLDYSICREPSTRDAILTPSAATGSITVTASASVFTGADVGRRVYLLDGYGDITAQSGTSATVTVVVPLIASDYGAVERVASGSWWVGDKSTTVTGLTAGEIVYAVGDCVDSGPYTVDGSGEIELDAAAGWVHVGRRNSATFRSMKLFQGTRGGIGIAGVTKRANEMGLALLRTGDCLRVGSIHEDSLDPLVIRSVRENSGAVFTGEEVQRIDGTHELDPRCWIIAEKATPATVLAYSPMHKANER